MRQTSYLMVGSLLLLAIVNCQSGEGVVSREPEQFTYIPLQQLLNLSPILLIQPCVSAQTFDNLLTNIDRWLQLLEYPQELQSDYLLLTQVRALIVAARDSALEVQAEFEIQQVQSSEIVFAQVSSAPINAFLQVSSSVELKTQVIQGVFYQEIQAIIAKLAEIKSNQDQSIGEQAQDILDALDKLAGSIQTILDQQGEFDTWIAKLKSLKEQVQINKAKCEEAGGTGHSVIVEESDKFLNGQPSSATIDSQSKGTQDETDGVGSAEIKKDDGLGSALINKNDGLGSAFIKKNDGLGSALLAKDINTQQSFAELKNKPLKKLRRNQHSNKK